tara:strand:+ start:281 stop:1420 length:1140 start_codon:yes stop_codon:yes gene_type:complete
MKIYQKILNQKIFLILTFLYIPLFRYYVDLNNQGGHTFMTADWLVNYKFGFVKRGLTGTFFMSLSEDKDILLDTISFTLIFIYLIIFYLLNKTYMLQKQNLLSLILIFSPATFLFPIYDSQGAFRKEILGFLCILFLSSFSNSPKKEIIKYISALIFLIAVFSHSVNAFFISTIFVILYKFYESRKVFDYFLFSFPLFLYLSMYFFLSSSEQELYYIRDNICLELSAIGLQNLCGYGTFDFLVWDINANYLIVQNYIINENRSQYIFYVILFIFAITPYLNEKYIYKNLKYYLFISITFVPLFVYAYDWGRWIYIMSMCYLVIFLLSEKKLSNRYFIYLFLIYPFIFRIEHCCKPLVHFEGNFLIKNFNYLLRNILSLI